MSAGAIPCDSNHLRESKGDLEPASPERFPAISDTYETPRQKSCRPLLSSRGERSAAPLESRLPPAPLDDERTCSHSSQAPLHRSCISQRMSRAGRREATTSQKGEGTRKLPSPIGKSARDPSASPKLDPGHPKLSPTRPDQTSGPAPEVAGARVRGCAARLPRLRPGETARSIVSEASRSIGSPWTSGEARPSTSGGERCRIRQLRGFRTSDKNHYVKYHPRARWPGPARASSAGAGWCTPRAWGPPGARRRRRGPPSILSSRAPARKSTSRVRGRELEG